VISLESITMQNFLSVGAVAQTVLLNQAPLTLILGANLDIGGENSRNGAGKTTILQAISYALYGEPLTKIKKDNLVNAINGSGLLVSIVFTREGVRYRIDRGRKPTTLRFLIGDRDVAQGERQTLQQIERIIGMSHTMFVHIVALNTFTTPFLKMGSSDQRAVIEELMGITQISQLAEQLKSLIDINKDELRDEEARIKAVSEANERIEQAIVQAQREATLWQQRQDARIRQLDSQTAQLVAIDIDVEFSIFDRIDVWRDITRTCMEREKVIRAMIYALDATILRLQNDVARSQPDHVVPPEIMRLQQQADRVREQSRQTIDAQLEQLRVRISIYCSDSDNKSREAEALQQDYDAITLQLASPDTHSCSVCGQGLIGTTHLQSVLATLTATQQAIAARRMSALADAKRYEDAVDEARRAVTQLQNEHKIQQKTLADQATMIEEEIITVQDTWATQQQRITDRRIDLNNELAMLHQQRADRADDLAVVVSDLRLAGVEPVSEWASRDALWRLREERERLLTQCETERKQVNPLAATIGGLTDTLLSISYDKLNDVSDQLKHEQFLYKLLTSKDSFIRKRIIDQNLGYLNRCLNKYLVRLGLPHEVWFMPDLSVEISLLGRDFDFEQLSRGEMNRVILATAFSFRDLFESLNTSYNLLFCDEIIDQGTDEAGVEAAVNMLASIADERQKNVFLISHRENLRARIDRVLIAQKFEQFTSFIDDSVAA
jgi:DNA repair exonuclease SbcCD ATPase subunit